MKRSSFLTTLLAIAGMAACESDFANGGVYSVTAPPYLPVTLSVESDNQGGVPEFPLSSDPLQYRAYIQAMPNERYRLRVVNNSEQRVGLVLAVDGRNIITGKKSYLKSNERMYILNPYESAAYEGWRTGSNQTNRFYFTEAANSYAAAWGDSSAMGVIAMAVYPERPRPEILQQESHKSRGIRGGNAPSADASASMPGTGFGEITYSPSTTVSFEPHSDALEKVALKYEWKETLCQKRVLPECRDVRSDENTTNRLWKNDHEGFAAPPPRR